MIPRIILQYTNNNNTNNNDNNSNNAKMVHT